MTAPPAGAAVAEWNARLAELTLTAGDPRAAGEHWAALLGGDTDADGVALAGDTRLTVVEGPREALLDVRFDAGPALAAAARALGATGGDGGRLGLADPDGWRLRLREVDEVAPQRLDGPILSHCTLNSPDPMRQRSFYEGLGFRLSDALGDVFSWLRPNPIHHAMAFSAHGSATIHHLAIELPDRSSFIGAIDRVVAAGARLEFGPGRHMVGGNLFAYLRDRHGLRWELCCEMGRLPDDRPPGLLSAADRGRSVNTFGPPPPASFIEEPGGPAPA